MSKIKRNYTPEFNAQVVLELLREEKTVNELAAEHQMRKSSWSKKTSISLTWSGRWDN